MSDTPAAVQAAQEQLYENEGLRRHLTDDQATPLLDWASQRLQAAGESSLEQAQNGVNAVLRLVDQAAAQDDGERANTLKQLPGLLAGLPGDGPPPPLPAELTGQAAAPASVETAQAATDAATQPTASTPAADAAMPPAAVPAALDQTSAQATDQQEPDAAKLTEATTATPQAAGARQNGQSTVGNTNPAAVTAPSQPAERRNARGRWVRWGFKSFWRRQFGAGRKTE